MTHIISHRVNRIVDLVNTPTSLGVEVDLRDHAGKIVLEHDPFNYNRADDFADYLREYKHGTLILNIKSERIEFQVLRLLAQFGITDYFFLDSSFPMIVSMVNKGESNIAVRFSEFEGLENIRKMRGKVRWVWVDCFSRLPIDKNSYNEIKELGLKLCLVSPELQGREEDIIPYRDYLAKESIIFDAICCKEKNFRVWQTYG